MSLAIHDKIDFDLERLIGYHEDIVKLCIKEGKTTTLTRGRIEGLREAEKVVFKRFKEAGVI